MIFSAMYTTFPHKLVKVKLTEFIRETCFREIRYFLACNTEEAFFTDVSMNYYTYWTCSDVCESLVFLLNNIFVCYGNTLHRQVEGIPMDTNCASLVADLFLYYSERDFTLSLDSQSRYLDDIFNIDNPLFDNMVPFIYPQELKLNKAKTSGTPEAFLDLDLSIDNRVISSKIMINGTVLISAL